MYERMKFITGFDEELSGDPPQIDEEFLKVFKALLLNQTVAENAFSRASKRVFREYTSGGEFLRAEDARALRPVWVGLTSIVLSVDTHNSDQCRPLSKELQDLVHSLGGYLNLSRGDGGNLVLIEPLKSEIQAVGTSDYKFTLKQRWSRRE